MIAAGATTRTLLAVVLAGAPQSGAQGPSTPAADEVRELTRQGDDAYETADYTSAVSHFEDAYAKAKAVEDDEYRQRAFRNLQFNLARAYEKAFEVERDVVHLRRARDLLRKYLAREGDIDDRLEAEKLLARVEDLLVEREADRSQESAPPENASPPEQQRADQVMRAHPMTIGGAVVAALSVGGIAMMTAGLVIGDRAVGDYESGPTRSDRDDAERRGGRANALAIAGGVTAGVLLGVGVALVVLGTRRANRESRVSFEAGLVRLQF